MFHSRQRVDGSRIYLHGIIDNFSRRILAWKFNSSFDTAVTAELITQAARGLNSVRKVVMDSSIENVNQTVDQSLISRVLARGRCTVLQQHDRSLLAAAQESMVVFELA